VAEAKAALFARLPEDARGAYWDALSRFVRFEITKSEFARACACLGPCVDLHNALIRALLQSAFGETSSSELVPSDELVKSEPASAAAAAASALEPRPPPVAAFAPGHPGMALTDGGTIVTHTRASRDSAVGSPLMNRGVWEIEGTIKKSKGNQAAWLLFGVCDAAAPPTPGKGGPGWGVSLYDGTVWQFNDALHWDGTVAPVEAVVHFPHASSVDGSSTILCAHRGLKLGEARRVIPGTAVGVRVDLEARTLAFRVGRGEWLPATGATLPAAVRPLVMMYEKDDSLALSARQVSGCELAPPPNGDAVLALPKLALRIRRDASGTHVVDAPPESATPAVPDEQAGASINAMHDKCSQIARMHGVTSVTPEAVSFLHKALKIHVYRMMSAGVHSRRGSSRTLGKRGRAEPTQLTREGLAEGMSQPHHLGTWTLPHSQRFNLAAAAYARQHFLL
jgi:hypothetical protein